MNTFFHDFSEFSEVNILDMLDVVYQPLFDSGILKREIMLQKWQHLIELSQKEKFCFFLTSLDSEIVGFGSIDPRDKPNGRIGHHVVLPNSTRNGIGNIQLKEMEKRLFNAGCSAVSCTTGDIDFFIPAQRLYAKNGYKLICKNKGEHFEILEYQKDISD